MAMRTDDNSVFSSLQSVTGVRHNRGMFNRDIIDNYILHKAREKGVRLPTGGEPDEYKFLGAFVETTTAGMNPNVVYCDLASLYPNNLLTLNASPETIIGTEQDLQESQYSRDDCVWGYIDPRPVKHLEDGESWQQYKDQNYKMIYDPDAPSVKWTCDEAEGPQYERLYFLDHDVQTGFMTECVQDLIELKNKYRGTSLYESVKRITNSIYGVLTFGNQNSSFRVFDWRLGEAITLSGRKIITRSRDYILDELHERGYTEAYACSGDTDATAVSVPSAATKDETLRVVTDIVEQLNDEGYDEIVSALTSDATVMPVLQGWTAQEYVDHLKLYGNRLEEGQWTGVGSICKRNSHPADVQWVLLKIKQVRPDLRLHGFGIKTTALQRTTIRSLLYSADSMAWSYRARMNGGDANGIEEAKQFAKEVREPTTETPLFN